MTSRISVLRSSSFTNYLMRISSSHFDRWTSSPLCVASTTFDVAMPYRSAARTIADLRLVLQRVEQNRQDYNSVSLHQLRRIVRRRIAALTAEMRGKSTRPANRRAA
jgi:hypothetical protein